jgi:HAMP domain-containing protein
LSTVVRLSVPETPAQGHDRLTELAVDAGAAFLLVAALALARWSQRRTNPR